MNRLLWWKEHFRAVEIPFSRWEMIVMRFAFAWVVYANLPGFLPFDQQPHPNGLGRYFDLTWLANPGLYSVLWWVAVGSLILYVLGALQAVALTFLSLLFLGIGTLENSQGAIEHYRQLVVMVLFGQAAVAWWQTASAWKKGEPGLFMVNEAQERKIVHWTRVVIAGAYLAMAITKIDRSKGRWIWDTPNLSVQIIKTQASELANSGVPPDPFYLETLPRLIADHPHLSRLFFSPGLWLEMVLFLGLMGRWWSLGLGLSLILLHRGIDVIMNLHFASHEWLLWVYFVNIPFWIFFLLARSFGWPVPGYKPSRSPADGKLA